MTPIAFPPRIGLLLGAFVATLCSCVSRQTITGPERSILGEWLVPSGQSPLGRALVSDTIDWDRINAEGTKDVLKIDSSADQHIRFRSNGHGLLRDETRGRIRFEYTVFCDSAHAYPQMGIDSAGYYVELVDQPVIPCELRIGSATYGLLREPLSPFSDSTQISRQLRVGGVIVSESYVMMIRQGR